MEAKIAEIIEASTSQFTAECYELYEMPPFGSLVRTGDIYGVVYNALTSSLESGRRPVARGKDETSEADVYKENPQLLKLLRSEIGAAVVGYRDGGEIRQLLSPYPARIHGFVYLCQPEEVREFGGKFGFLNILLNAALPVSTDELVSAVLRRMSQSHEYQGLFLVSAGKELASLLSHDFIRLKNILGRLQ